MRTIILISVLVVPAAAHAQTATVPEPAEPATTAAPATTATPPAGEPASPTAEPASPTAEPKPWKVGIEPRFGFALPTSKLGANVGGGLEIDIAVAMQGKLVVGVDASLTQPSYSSTVMDSRIPGGMTTYDIHQTELLVGATIQYRIPASAKLVPRVGLGPAVHMLKTNETTAAAPGNNTAQQTKLGLEALAGVDYRLGPGYLAGDLRLIYSGLDTPLTGSSNAGNIGLAVGYRIVF